MPQFVEQGSTTVSRIKAMLLHIERCYGSAQADSFVLSTQLDREYLEDETRPVSIQLWRRALDSFTSRWGPSEIDRLVFRLVDPEMLGVWARVLRGADTPAQAYAQIDQLGGDDSATDRWRATEVDARRGSAVIIAQADRPEEEDGLGIGSRVAELAALPLLFGLARAKVTVRPLNLASSGGKTQEFFVTWKPARPRGFLLAPGLGAVVAVSVSYWVGGSWSAAIAVAVLAGLLATLGVLGAYFVNHFRIVQLAHRVRLRALERSLALREIRDKRQNKPGEGAMIAGQYRLGALLGSGASGTIWEATRLSDRRVVAVKLLRAAVAHDTVAADRLRREAAALGLAWHPNVVEVFDDGHLTDGTSYLVMERLHGESLAARLRRQGAIAAEDLLPIAMQVCDALDAVHAAGIVHRDLKPSNIFLARVSERAGDEETSRGPVTRVKLLDFGIARVEWAETRLTNAGAPLGTPGYMSPEQELGLEIDARSDLFSLGRILFECLCGQSPPPASERLQPPTTSRPDSSMVQPAFREIPAGWRQLMERATDSLPHNRFANARVMRAALLELSSSQADPRGSATSAR